MYSFAQSQLIGQRIKARRNALGWTQRELAKRAGYEQAVISGLELAYRIPAVHHVEDVAQALKVSVSALTDELAPSLPTEVVIAPRSEADSGQLLDYFDMMTPIRASQLLTMARVLAGVQ